MADIGDGLFEFSHNEQVIRAMIRVLENSHPGLRSAIAEELESAADHYEALSEPKRAEAIRDLAKAAFFKSHRNTE